MEIDNPQIALSAKRKEVKNMHLTKFLLMKEIDENTTLLINSLSGAVDLIGKREQKSLFYLREKKGGSLLDKELETKLRERGYLFDTEEEEKTAFRHLVKLFSRRQITLPEFYLCYTYSCNLKCTYCNERHLNNKVKKIRAMQSEQVEAALKAILTIRKDSKVKGGVIVLFGGEPLLPINRDSVIRTLSFAREENFSIRIVSNGVLIEKFIEVLRNYQDVIEVIAISLNGPRDIHNQRRKAVKGNSFDKIVDGINTLLSKGLEVEVRPIVDQENIAFLPELTNFIIGQGWTGYKNFSAMIAKTMFPFQTAKLDYPFVMSEPEFIKQLSALTQKHPQMAVFGDQWLRDFEPFVYLREILDGQEIVAHKLSGCRAVTPGMYIFGPDNLIYPCLELVGIPQYATGRFFPEFENFSIRERWRKFKVLKWSPKCRKCNLLNLCGGGCSLTYLVWGNRDRDDQGCDEIKKTLDTYLEVNKTKFVNLLSRKERCQPLHAGSV